MLYLCIHTEPVHRGSLHKRLLGTWQMKNRQLQCRNKLFGIQLACSLYTPSIHSSSFVRIFSPDLLPNSWVAITSGRRVQCPSESRLISLAHPKLERSWLCQNMTTAKQGQQLGLEQHRTHPKHLSQAITISLSFPAV